jgi:DNA-binding MarR family transcriptional regulator
MHASSAQTDTSAAHVAAELLSLWTRLMKGSSKGMYELLAELDLSITHIKTMHVLADCQGIREMSVKEVGEELGMSLPNASRTVEHLLQRGFLERREDERDRRVKRIAVTVTGLDVVHRIDTARLQGLESWAETLTDEQRRRLLDALSHLPKDPA